MTEVLQAVPRMLRDRLLIRPIEWDASKTIVAIRQGRAVRGEVIAAGPGSYPKRHVKGVRDGKPFHKTYETEIFVPTEVTPGDIVELGGLNAFDGHGYAFQEVLVNNVMHFICQEADVAIVRDDLHSDCNCPDLFEPLTTGSFSDL